MEYNDYSDTVIDDVRNELYRQLELKFGGKFKHVLYDADCPNIIRVSALVEEVGEVCKSLQENNMGLYEELVQVAALAVSWASRIAANG